MSALSQWMILFRVHVRMLRIKAVVTAKSSRLMTATISGFLIAYTVAAYFLFSKGLGYVSKLPAAGSLLSDRLIYVIFFCFMMMLTFSVAVTGYISLYRNRDTQWLLTLPVSHRVVFSWKCFEASAFSSWGLIFILAPLIAAFARTRDVLPPFFIKTAVAMFPFMIIASAAGAILLVTAVRWLSKRQILIAASAIALLIIGTGIKEALEDNDLSKQTGLSAALTFQRVLHHTHMTINPSVPSTWLASSIIDWSRPYRSFSSFLYPSLLVSNGLMGILMVSFFGKLWFYKSWNKSLQHAANSAYNNSSKEKPSKEQVGRDYPSPILLRKLTGRPLAAISRKDFLTFIREPAQWVQFTVIFGLLGIYSGGLRQMNSDIGQPRDLYLVAFLNLAVCALALSTLTTRFVFPQFSLEGRRLWILAMSPLRLQGIVTQKFVSSTLCSGMVVIVILLISGYNLQLELGDSLFFATAIGMLAIGLNAIAVGLGVLFPNLEESNAAKIVSGFGGTLCLVGSFIYIVLAVLLLAYARYDVFLNNEVSPGWFYGSKAQLGMASVVFLTLMVTLVPLSFSRKKLKRLEILSNI